MAYLGPPPSQKLATPTSQYFSGNGSATAFTLNRPVNVAEDLNVFVNNVAQQPGSGKSYTATGTTLTFDAAPDAGTNNVYVVYRGLSEGTLRLEQDPNSGITATTGTFSGDLTVDTTTLKVDSTNNLVGIGTASPSSFYSLADNLVVGTGSGGNGMTIFSGSSDSGYIGFNDTASNSMQGFIQYNHNGDYMAFAPNGSEKIRITSGGQVLVGTTDTSPCNNTSASGISLSANEIQIASSSSEGLYLNRYGSNGRVLNIRKGGTFIGGIDVSTSQVTYNQTSDYRLKENVSYTWDATARLKQLKPARFNYLVDPDNIVDGFLAHEVSEACPSAITGEKDAVDSDGNIDPQCIDHSKLVPLLCKTILELEARITALELN
jgi:hypothetical protein